jgi:hypothetical protein
MLTLTLLDNTGADLPSNITRVTLNVKYVNWGRLLGG